MGSPLRALRREQIIAAARRIVADDGLESLTIAAIENAVDFSRGVITYHFRDKDEIVEAVLRSAVDEIDANLVALGGQDLDPEAQVETALRTVLQGFLDRPEAARILLSFSGRIHADPRMAAMSAELYGGYRRWSGSLIEAHGDRFAPVDADGLAGVMVGIVIGLATQTWMDPEGFDPAPALDEACAAVLARLRSG